MPKSPSLVPKIFHFSVFKFWKIKIFDLHVQYVHQMKAGDILNSKLLSKNTTVGEIFVKTGFSKFLLWILRRKKNFEGKFFGNFFYHPPIHVFQLFKTPKMKNTWRFGNPHCNLSDTVSCQSRCGLFQPPPGFLRVKVCKASLCSD